MKRLRQFLLGAALVVMGGVAVAQEPVQTNRATELRATPDDAGKVVQQLANKTDVRVVTRQGAWQQVRVGANIGWVRMMHLRGGSSVVAETPPAYSTYLAALTRLLAGSADRTRGTQRAQSATVGIRGFSKEDVERAELNPAELEKLKKFQRSDADGRRLAGEGRLAFRSVAYLAQDAVEAGGKQGAGK